MNRPRAALCLFLTACAARGVDQVPSYAITDTFVTGPTMLVRAGINGEVREIWSGMDARRARHVPLFLETTLFAEVRSGDGWTDLRTRRYRHDGTRPGYIRLRSDDGQVSIEVTARKNAEQSPIFVHYTFARPVDLRLVARLKYPEFTQAFRSDDAAGLSEFSTAWRGVNPVLTTTSGPRLILAEEPRGRTVSIDRGGVTKEFAGTRDLLLCLDATESDPGARPGESYAGAWSRLLGGVGDTESEYVPNRVALTSDDPKLDRLFEYSLDAVESTSSRRGRHGRPVLLQGLLAPRRDLHNDRPLPCRELRGCRPLLRILERAAGFLGRRGAGGAAAGDRNHRNVVLFPS